MARGADSSAPDSTPHPQEPAHRRGKALTLRAAQAPEKQRQESTLHFRERSSGLPRQVPAPGAPHPHRSARRRAATALCAARPRVLARPPQLPRAPPLPHPCPLPAPRPAPCAAWPRPLRRWHWTRIAGGGESLPVVCFFPSLSLVRYPA